MASKCCPTHVKPAINNYQGVGHKETIDDLFDLYVTTGSQNPTAGTSKPKHAIFVIYDIFGWTPNAEQLADRLAFHTGYLVCIPDVMRGQAWPPDNMPPTKSGG
mmetsp:Transcript_8139/g.12885  ORF Transcript_8139/g.12885 Transcript_8139/m.12885 type:complete len:104 (+) Transcript_8139:46-357(+)